MTDRDDPETDEVSALSALGEPTRRALYEFVAGQGDWVGRDRAADATGLERGTAAHHLDRLAADGLLDVEYRRISGRQGPGAGRPAKLYRRSGREFGLSLPPRDYELAGRLLAEAADRSRTTGTDIATAVDDAAAAEGRRVGGQIRARLRRAARRGADAGRRAAVDVLAHHGYEPHVTDDGTVVLRNCPFHRLARSHTELICRMNLCLVGAALDAAASTGLDARLEPEDGTCCVRLRPAPTAAVVAPGRRGPRPPSGPAPRRST